MGLLRPRVARYARNTSQSCNGSQKPRGPQQEMKGGEGQTSRMRHALPKEVIHLHIYYAKNLRVFL